MPLDGFRWSCDSDSALCDMRQTNVLGRAGGGKMTFLFDIIPMLLQEEFPVLCLVVYLASSMVMESCLKLRHSLSWNSWSVLLGSTVHG